MDVRDFEFWFRESQRKTLSDKIFTLRMSRMAWAEGDAARDEMRAYQNALESLDGQKQKRYAKTWKEAIGKHKG